MNKEEALQELMRRTSKGRFACDLALQLSGGDVNKAIERMRVSYPSMEVKP